MYIEHRAKPSFYMTKIYVRFSLNKNILIPKLYEIIRYDR